MNTIRKLFKIKNININLLIIAILGILLMLINKNTIKNTKKISTKENIVENNLKNILEEQNTEKNYEELLESKLEKVLSKAEGVGKLKVMLTFSYGKEIILAEDTIIEESNTTETDAEGGNRHIKNKNTNKKNLLISDLNGANKPIILKEIHPKVEGVIIVAEGGDNVFIKQSLINSTKAVLGVDAHKINILKMSIEK